MKIRKGDYGYIRREKKKRLLVTLGLFVLPAIVFIVGLVLSLIHISEPTRPY